MPSQSCLRPRPQYYSQVQFGLSLEFAFSRPHPPTGYGYHVLPRPAQRSWDHACIRRVARSLEYAGYPAATVEGGYPRRPRRQLLLLKDRFETLTNGDRYPGYSCWVLLTDEHLAARINLRDHIPTQLSTPIMSETEVDQGYISTQASLIELAMTVDEKILLTESCGLRKNVSIAETARAESLSLREAKRMTTLVLLLEDVLLWPLCPAKRKEFFSPLSHSRIVVASHMVQVNPEYRLEDDDQARLDLPPIMKEVLGNSLKTVWACPSVESLADGLKEADPVGLRTAVRLARHRHPHADDDWSMEFRHAPASFRPIFIEDWLNVVLTIAKAASLTSRQFREVIGMVAEHLLDVLGAAMRPYWSVRLPGRNWTAELEMLKHGINPNVSEDGTPIFP